MVRGATSFGRTKPPVLGRVGALVLASRSPRRRRLLEEAGIPHIAEESGLEDSVLVCGRVSARAWVAALAYLKAAAGRHRWGGGATVLGADTVCVMDGRIIGQARDAADAERILTAFEGREHQVVTGVAVLSGSGATVRRELFADAASVRVGRLGRQRIEEYVASGAWAGKAGAYNLEERLAAGWPIEYEGDPTTILGLPMRRLLPRLARLGIAGAGP